MDWNPVPAKDGTTVLARVPHGFDALILGDLARLEAPALHVHVARDDQRMASLAEALAFFAPDIPVLRYPAWDGLPYDRVSPVAEVVAERLATLAALADKPRPAALLLTTVNAILQRTMPPDVIGGASLAVAPGIVIATGRIEGFLSANGYVRSSTVVDPGDFAVRGGIIDIFPPGAPQPVRLDFFGDGLESIRSFDPQSQRTTGQLHRIRFLPASEAPLTGATIARFRARYAAEFGGVDLDDPLYETVTAGRRYQGMEHWLPLFHEKMSTLFDYTGGCSLSLDHLAEEAARSRLDQISEYFDARKEALDKDSFGAAPYKPLPPERLYLTFDEWKGLLAVRPILQVSPFDQPPAAETRVRSMAGEVGRSFAAERATPGANVFDAVRLHIDNLRKSGKRVAIAAWTEGAASRLETILKDHGVAPIAAAASWTEVQSRPGDVVSTVVLGLEHGFEAPGIAVIAEQDILGDRLVRRAKNAPGWRFHRGALERLGRRSRRARGPWHRSLRGAQDNSCPERPA